MSSTNLVIKFIPAAGGVFFEEEIMLALEKIIASLIMPPGLFVLILFILTVYLFKKSESQLIKILALFMLLLFFLLSTAAGVQLLLHPLENYAEKISVNAFERHPIVVLGGGLNYHSREEAAPSLHSMQRLVKGYQLHRRLNTPLIYSGGVAIGQEKISEADAAAEFLERLGSAAVFKAQNIDFLVVHSGFIYDHQFSWLDYLPNRGALTANLSALHEWVGLVWYYIRGRI